MAKVISQEQREEIVRLLKTGATGADISEITGISRVTIGKYRKKLQKEGFDIWHRGSKIAMSIPCANENPADKENSMEAPKKRTSLIFERKITRFCGETSGFKYTIGQRDYSVIIQDKNGSTLSFETEEEFSAFVCELIDLSSEIEKERM